MAEVYETVDDVDAWVGGLAEPLALQILADSVKLRGMTGDAQKPRPGAELVKAFDVWRSAPARSHAAALVLLVAAMTLRYHATVLAAEPIEDEGAYFFIGFSAVAEGRSPYNGGYFYTPAFAYAGAWAMEHLGIPLTLALLRAANLLGMAGAAWCSFAWLPWSWRARLLGSAAFVCLSPAVRLGAQWGNLSFLVTGMIITGLVVWRSRPVVAGLLLGLSVVIKPLGPLAVLALGAHRPSAGSRRHLKAAGVASAVAAGLTLPVPYLAEMLSFGGKLGTGRNVALQRLFHCFGVEVSAFVIAVAVAVAVLLAVRSRPLARTHLLCLACTASLLATPILWSHTMLLALPLEVLAIAVAVERRRSQPPGFARRYELAVIVILVLAIQLCEGVGGVEGRALWLQGLVGSIPAFSPAVLTIYLLRTTEPF